MHTTTKQIRDTGSNLGSVQEHAIAHMMRQANTIIHVNVNPMGKDQRSFFAIVQKLCAIGLQRSNALKHNVGLLEGKTVGC